MEELIYAAYFIFILHFNMENFLLQDYALNVKTISCKKLIICKLLSDNKEAPLPREIWDVCLSAYL